MMKYLTTDLEKILWLKHGFFTRQGGVSTGLYTSLNCGLKTDDTRTNIKENRARVAAQLELKPENLVIAKQVHGAKVHVVTKPWTIETAPEADGIVTAKPGIGLGILTADCAPVLFAAKKEKIIGACHAGWKGAVGGVLEATVEAMKKLGAKTADIEAAIGPCIGPLSYEVREDFTSPFLKQDKANAKFFKPSPKQGHLIFDLPAYTAHRLALAGVKTIFNTRQDTLTGEIFFSNRRAFLKSEKGFGLQVSVIAVR